MQEKALEDSLGDEGYAAWLQYREIQRFKRDKQALMVEDTDSRDGTHWVMVNENKGTWFTGNSPFV